MLTWDNPPELKGTFEYNESRPHSRWATKNHNPIYAITPKKRSRTTFLIWGDIRTRIISIKNRMENNPSWINLTSVFKGQSKENDIARRDEIERLPRDKEDTVYNNIRAIERRDIS